MQEIYDIGWFRYLSDEHSPRRINNPGKWMIFFTDQQYAQELCQTAVLEGICYEAKCRDLAFVQSGNEGVICFYADGDDPEDQKKVLAFLLNHDYVPHTRAGKLYNIAFKFDSQTRALEYGDQFKAKVNLSTFVDPDTGEWL